MRPWTITFIHILLTVLVQTQINTFYFDTSCDNVNGLKIEMAMGEAIAMAKNAVNRIQNPNDQVTERLFRTIYKKARNEAPKPLS